MAVWMPTKRVFNGFWLGSVVWVGRQEKALTETEALVLCERIVRPSNPFRLVRTPNSLSTASA
jgi:hypothetical protein